MKIENPRITEKSAFEKCMESNIEIPKPDFNQNDFNAYISNNSVSFDVSALFFQSVMKYESLVKKFEGEIKDIYEKIINLLANILTQELRIFVRHDRWLYFFNGKHYDRCSSNQEIQCIIRELCELASSVWNIFSCTGRTARDVLKNVSEIAIQVDYPDDISKYIVMNNGVLNLENMKLENFTLERFMTNMVRADWIENDESCPMFDKIISTYTNNDDILNDRINEVLGVCLTNDYVKKFFCFLGVTNSGKSFLLNFLMRLINNQSSVVMQPNDFGRQFAPSMVYGKSLCCCMDMDSAPLNSKATAFIKGVSGFDILSAEFKGQNGCVPFQSRAHIINASNFDITTKTLDTAFDMRKLVVPFKYRLTDNAEPFEVLMAKLEAEKPAIVRKLINAYIRLKDNNYVFSGTDDWYDTYVPPTAVSISTDKSLQFFFCTYYSISENKNDYVFTEDMYNMYKKFATEKEDVYWFPNYDSFSKAVKNELNLETGRKRKDTQSNPKRCYLGIVLKTDSAESDSDNFPNNAT